MNRMWKNPYWEIKVGAWECVDKYFYSSIESVSSWMYSERNQGERERECVSPINLILLIILKIVKPRKLDSALQFFPITVNKSIPRLSSGPLLTSMI